MECSSYVIGLALLYKKIYAGIDKISLEKITKFQSMINVNMKSMGGNIENEMLDSDSFKIWSSVKDEGGNIYFYLSPAILLDEVWQFYIDNLPVTLWIASLKNNALKEIDLIFVDDNIVDMVSYYSELRKKHDLDEIDISGFDIFREWEKLAVDGFVEKYCLTNGERAVLNVLRKSKKNAGYVVFLRKYEKM